MKKKWLSDRPAARSISSISFGVKLSPPVPSSMKSERSAGSSGPRRSGWKSVSLTSSSPPGRSREAARRRMRARSSAPKSLTTPDSRTTSAGATVASSSARRSATVQRMRWESPARSMRSAA
jgi:hypothetical protein